jgi:hypothetical protein
MARPAICSACDHCFKPLICGVSYGCRRPLSDRRDLVTGELSDRVGDDCIRERRSGRTFFGLGRLRCGPEGRFFTPIEEVGPPRGGSGEHKANLRAVK